MIRKQSSSSLGLRPLHLAITLVLMATSHSILGQPESGDVAQEMAIVHVNVVPVDREGVLVDHDVVVRGERIAAVGPAGTVEIPASAHVVDGHGLYLLPGLVDAHIHLEEWLGCRPDFGDAAMYLSAGITSVINLRGFPEHLQLRQRIADGELLAPNLYTSGEFVNEPRVTTPEEAEQEVLAQARAGYDLVKFHQVVDESTGQYSTTVGLDLATYRSMCEACRKAGIPLVGHLPAGLGLEALLENGQSLAHINELTNLYFLNFNQKMAIVFLIGLALMILVCCTWLIALVLGRLRRTGGGTPVLGRLRLTFSLLLGLGVSVAILWLQVYAAGPRQGEVPLLVTMDCLLTMLLAGAVYWCVLLVRTWSTEVSTVRTRASAAIAAAGLLCLVAAELYWVPVAWRSTDRHLERVAHQCKDAGIWVQSSILLQETALGIRDDFKVDQLKRDPMFSLLPGEVQEELGMIDRLVPQVIANRARGLARFNRRLFRALFDAGVPLMAGTDAMGAPFVLPGTSFHRELGLIAECGLDNAGILELATIGPARFLGKEHEFGTVTAGKRADLLLVDQNPLEDIAALGHASAVVIRGQWLERVQLDNLLSELRDDTEAP